MGAQVVDWKTHCESNGCRPRLSLPLPWGRRGLLEPDCHWGEKWVHHFTTEMKSTSQQWVGKGDERTVKAKREMSVGKVHLTAFWDNEGILLKEYAPKGVTITRELYFDTLMHLREAIKKNIPENCRVRCFSFMTTQLRIWLVHHVSACWFLVGRLSASRVFLRLPPSDYNLFPAFHCWRGGRCFKDDDAAKVAVHEYFAKLDRNFFTDGISKLITWYEKCLSRMEAYVEK